MDARLVYVSDSDPGITRRRCGRGFSYTAPDGTTIARGPERTRIEALAVPPAYEDVWICVRPDGHLQATGRDARQRKQYRYHPDWSATRAATKFDRLAEFGTLLPRIRRRVRRDLETDAGARQFALAAAVSLIDSLALRAGNETYTRQNGTFGALTLRKRHLKQQDDAFELRFRAKGGKRVRESLPERRLNRLLNKISDLPGRRLLSWQDDDGEVHSLTSQALNDYISEAAGETGVTAKTFRTWAGSLAAYEAIEAGARTIGEVTEAAARRLHNTPTVARNSYIHPAVIDLVGEDLRPVDPAKIDGLLAAEKRLLGLLSQGSKKR